jgi:urease accessory protein
MIRLRRLLAFAGLLTLVPALAHAHPGHDGHELTWDFQSGFLHPLSGWDHLLAMIAIGLWAAQLGGRARWLLPAAFVGTMALAAAVGSAGFAFSCAEQGVAASVLLLGLLVATSTRISVGVGMTLAAGFAAFHGLAHGAEMAPGANAMGYGAGFIFATVLLHAVGLGLGAIAKESAPRAARWVGCAIAVSGIVLLAG